MSKQKFKLPIFATLKSAFEAITINARPLLIALIFPTVLLIIVENFQYYSMLLAIEDSPASRFTETLGLFFARYALLVLFAVTCHRIVLLGRESLPNKAGIYCTIRELKYFGWVILLLAPMFVLTFSYPFLLTIFDLNALTPDEYWQETLTSLYANSFEYVYLVIASLLLAILGVVLPSIAVGDTLSLKQRILLVKGNVLRLTILFAIPVLVISLFLDLVQFVGADIDSNLYALATTFVFYALLVFEVAVLSTAYKALIIKEL